MTVDSSRKLVFMSRDSGTKGQIIVDLNDPWHPKVIGFNPNWQGHTSTCIDDCRFLWSVGGDDLAARRAAARRSRSPTCATRCTRSSTARRSRPTSAAPASATRLDALRRRRLQRRRLGLGHAAASAATGPRACTRTRRPARTATPRRITRSPYAGGQITGNESAFMHNSYHFPTAVGKQPAGDVMLVTNENNNTTCATRRRVHHRLARRHLRRRRPAEREHEDDPARDVQRQRAGGPVPRHGGHAPPSATARRTGSRSRATSSRSATTSRARASSTCPTRRTRSRSAGTASRPVTPRTRSRKIISSDTSAPTGTASTSTRPTTSAASTSSSSTRAPIAADPAEGVLELLRDTQVVDARLDVERDGRCRRHGARRRCHSRWARPRASARSRRASPRTTRPSTTANVVSTAGDAALRVADPSATATGHLVNGAFSLPTCCRPRPPAPAGAGRRARRRRRLRAPTPCSPTPARSPTTRSTVGFQQHIGASDALRTGSYSKTLTFTLSTTTP